MFRFAFLLSLFWTTLVFASAFEDLGPVAKSAFLGLQRKENKFTPDSHAPFFSIGLPAQCSATYVTNDGYFLLALHCLEKCIDSNGEKQDSKNYGIGYDHMKVGEGYITLGEINEYEVKGLSCPFQGAGYKAPGLRARIISIGSKAFVAGNDFFNLAKTNLQTLQQLLNQGYNGIAGSGDFALMKMDDERTKDTALPSTMSAPGECLPLAQEDSVPGDTVWSLTFPSLNRKIHHGSIFSPLTTGGRVFDLSQSGLAAQEQAVVSPNQQVVSVDADAGSSGGSYFDENGAIRGIMVSIGRTTNEYQKATTVGIKTSHMLEHFKADLSPELYDHLVNGCQMTSTTHNLIREIVQTKNAR